MSIIDQAKAELALVNFGEDDSGVMVSILRQFFNQWDSGGAVAFAAPVLMKLIAGKPLSPLTGADEEWTEVADGVFQNKRCSSVFKDPRFHDGKLAYDIDAPEPRAAIAFPYSPGRAEVPPPVFQVASDPEW